MYIMAVMYWPGGWSGGKRRMGERKKEKEWVRERGKGREGRRGGKERRMVGAIQSKTQYGSYVIQK